MGFEQLIRQGWFSRKQKDLDIDLTPTQISEIKNGSQVVVQKDGKEYLIYIKSTVNIQDLTPEDVIVREIPAVATVDRPTLWLYRMTSNDYTLAIQYPNLQVEICLNNDTWGWSAFSNAQLTDFPSIFTFIESL